MPRSAEAIVFVPRLGVALERLRLLATTLAQVPQGELLGQGLDEVSAQLAGGSKPEDLPEALGLDRARPMALVVITADAHDPQLVLALPVKDRKALTDRLAKLTASRFGAREEEEAHSGKRFVAKDGATVAALRFDDRAGGTAFVALGARADALLDSTAGLQREASLARSPDYQACRARWSDMDLWVFLGEAAGARLQPFGFKPERGLGVGLAFGKDGVRARAVALLTVGQSTLASSIVVPPGGTGASLAGVLSPAAALWLRLRVDFGPLADSGVARSLPGPVTAALEAAGIDPRELLANVGTDVVMSVGLSDQPSFHVMPSLDPREANPFAFLVLRAACRVRDTERARAMLAKIEAAGPRYGVTYRARSVAGVQVQTASYAQGESVSLALSDRTLLVTGGQGEMERALAALAAPANPTPLDPKTLVSLRLDVPTLLTQVEAAPTAAFGGFAGLTVRSLVTRLASPMAHFGPIDATLALDAEAVSAELKVPLR